jgi:hypothetical protein
MPNTRHVVNLWDGGRYNFADFHYVSPPVMNSDAAVQALFGTLVFSMRFFPNFDYNFYVFTD